MLYNQDWDKELKTDILTMQSLIAWLETMPANAEYNWSDIEKCLCAQYFGGGRWAPKHKQFREATGLELDSLAYSTPHTFGAALERATAYAKECSHVV